MPVADLPYSSKRIDKSGRLLRRFASGDLATADLDQVEKSSLSA